ncbi:MAG: hypothetical protein HQM08_04255 [Candidatus Riflebacteria bacterium]|nr:hypothetical protein [Candidatus Riflebacteria bacterium]
MYNIKSIEVWQKGLLKEKKLFLLSIMILFLLESQLAQSVDLKRFLPTDSTSPVVPTISLPQFLPLPKHEISPKIHNKGVALNNEGLKAMKNEDLEGAMQFFQQAAACDPNEVAFLNNLALVLQKNKKKAKQTLEVCRKILAIDGENFPAAFSAGITILEQMNKPLEALPYLELARKLKPSDVQVITALASAWDKTGFPDQAISLLNDAAPLFQENPYPLYLLGILLLGKNEYSAAMRALKSASEIDREGYAREAYARAAYFSGQLTGLAEFCKETLRDYSNLPNKQSLERILFSLTPHKIIFTETINIELRDPTSLNELSLLVRPLPTVFEHQEPILESSEWQSKGSACPVQPSPPDEDGRLKFSASSEIVQKKISLKLKYSVLIKPTFGATNQTTSAQVTDVANYSSNQKLELDNPNLKALSDSLNKIPGNFLQTAFEAVGRGLSYHENFEENPISWIFENLENCDCTEYSLLFVALCLSRGFPARVATGFLLKKEAIGHDTNIGHAWAEVYAPGKGWIPIDPTLGQNLHWAYFGNLLSDQLLFDLQEPGRKNRVTANLTASTSDIGIKISSSFCFNLAKP